MKNEKPPEDSGLPWNTDDAIIEGMTCAELARFSTCYVSALRMCRQAFKTDGAEGLLEFLANIFIQQAMLIGSENLTVAERSRVSAHAEIALQSCCLAAMSSLGKSDPRALAAISMGVIDSVHALAQKTGPIGEDDEVVIDIQRSPESDGSGLDAIRMKVSLQPLSDLTKQMENNPLGKEIRKVVEKTAKPKPTPPMEFGPN